jgi:hypothetical protein
VDRFSRSGIGMKAARLFLSFPRALAGYHRETGRSLFFWATLALLSLATQIIFRRNLQPGEFATLNTLLAVVGLAAVPIIALRQALAHFSSGEGMNDAREALLQNFTLAWAFICALAVLPALDLLELPRFSLEIWTLLNVFLALGAVFTADLFAQQGRRKTWAFLFLFAGVIQLLFVWLLTTSEPWAETGLAAGTVAGLILVAPLFRQPRFVLKPAKARELLRDREFRRYLIATCCIVVGTFLFTNADRIVAQAWFGEPVDNNMGVVHWGLFDGYQTAGLLGRSLLWGTQPILLLLLARRAGQKHTAADVRKLCWFYLGTLVIGAIFLHQLTQPLSRLFGGANQDITAYFIPGFAFAMIPLGLLQGLGVFALASRRYPECFTFGAASLAYTLLLALVGTPQLIQSYMFGGGLVALFLLLFLGVVRWGRIQP